MVQIIRDDKFLFVDSLPDIPWRTGEEEGQRRRRRSFFLLGISKGEKKEGRKEGGDVVKMGSENEWETVSAPPSLPLFFGLQVASLWRPQLVAPRRRRRLRSQVEKSSKKNRRRRLFTFGKGIIFTQQRERKRRENKL